MLKISEKIITFLKPTPFKIGCLVTLTACFLFYSFGHQKPALLEAIDSRIADTMFRLRGPRPTTQQVVIVDIDERSLRDIGQWPWPRDKVAAIVKNLKDSGAKVIGFDIVFAEEDRTSPRQYIETFHRLFEEKLPAEKLLRLKNNRDLDNDFILGDALIDAPTILGYVFLLSSDDLKREEDKPFPTCNIYTNPSEIPYSSLALKEAYRPVLNIQKVAQASSEGFFNVFPDASGTVSRVPLFMSLDNIPYPSLAMEMLRIGLGEQDIVLHISEQVRIPYYGLLGVSLGQRFIPTNDVGEIYVNYRGPSFTFPYFSAGDILLGGPNPFFKDKYVLLGTSAAGLHDTKGTPFSNVFPGVEIHATIIDNVLAGDPFSHDVYTEIGITYTLIIIGGLILTFLLSYTSPLAGGLSGLILLGGTVLFNYFFFFLNNKFVGLTYQLGTITILFLTVTLFNYFFEGREKRFIHSAFGHYISPQIVGQLVKHPDKLLLAGEQRNLTVMFCDLRNFTRISERMDSQQLAVFLNEHLTAMSRLIMEQQGMVDKYIGDAIMALWGAPLDDKDHAANGVRAAFRMMDKLRELQKKWRENRMPVANMGIGINTGIMSVGNFGSEQRFDYTVMGDNVNLASRLESSNKIYGTNIIISEFTRQQLGDRFFCRLVDVVRVKGKTRPVKIYEPLIDLEIGTAPEVLQEEIKNFEKAFGFYQHKNFSRSREILEELQTRSPSRLYRLYINRIDAFAETPPPPDWDGVFTFTTK